MSDSYSGSRGVNINFSTGNNNFTRSFNQNVDYEDIFDDGIKGYPQETSSDVKYDTSTYENEITIDMLEKEYNKLVEIQKSSWEIVRRKMVELDQKQQKMKEDLLSAGRRLDSVEKLFRKVSRQEQRDLRTIEELGQDVPLIKKDVDEVKEILDMCPPDSLGGARIIMKNTVEEIISNVEKQLDEHFANQLENSKIEISEYDKSFAEERLKRLKQTTESIRGAVGEVIENVINDYNAKVERIMEQHTKDMLNELTEAEKNMKELVQNDELKTTLVYTPSRGQLKDLDKTVDPIEEKIATILSSNKELGEYTEEAIKLFEIEKGFEEAKKIMKECREKYPNLHSTKNALNSLRAITERATSYMNMIIDETETQIKSIEALNKSMKDTCPNGDLKGYAKKITLSLGPELCSQVEATRENKERRK